MKELRISEIKPVFNFLLVTANKYEEDVVRGGIITDKNATKGNIKWYQTVVSIGSTVRDFKPGDKVMLNPANFVVRKYDKNSIQNDMDNNPVLSYNLPVITVHDKEGVMQEYLYISDRDILYSFEGEEVEKNTIIVQDKKIIVN